MPNASPRRPQKAARFQHTVKADIPVTTGSPHRSARPARIIIPPELLEEFRMLRPVTLFVGAGFSTTAVTMDGAADPMPVATDLAARLRRVIGDPPLKKGDQTSLGELAEYYMRATSRPQLMDWLSSQLRDDKRKLPDDLAADLRNIAFAGIVTTNYDTLLERALTDPKTGHRPTVWTQEEAVPRASQNAIFKLCGTVDRPEDTILLADSDFDASYRIKNRNLVERIHDLYRDSTLLFIGYGLHDYFFRLGWSEILRAFGESRRRSYAVVPIASLHEKRYWEARHIAFIQGYADEFTHQLSLAIDAQVAEQEMTKYLMSKLHMTESKLRAYLAGQRKITGLRDDYAALLNEYRLSLLKEKRKANDDGHSRARR